uniref:Pentatricopeptide repeat-containing protein At4g37380, chloroplastic n=1 Tax=Anthurium amnicola TaxID=1678845 RepID=A0A1D1ZG93_9ARAE
MNHSREPSCGLQAALYRLLRLSSATRHLQQIHARFYLLGLHQDHFLITHLISLCHRLGDVDHALAAYAQTRRPTTYPLNAVLEALADAGDALKRRGVAVYLAQLRVCHGGDATRRPNCFTFSPLLRSCVDSTNLVSQVHCHITKFGAHADVYVGTTLLDSYSKRGKAEVAQQLFDEMPVRSIVSWNSMISGLARNGDVVGAQELFDEMPQRNNVSWASMITGYAQNGHFHETLLLFDEMASSGIELDKMAAVSVLSACANLGALGLGKKLHQYLDRAGCSLDLFIGGALVDMYSKCGVVDQAVDVFTRMPEKNVVVYSSMIMGLAMNGRCIEALMAFEDMRKEGIQPNDITLVGVMCACCHGGLIDEGRQYFKSMGQTYSITPKLQHYACMVDLLGRAGQVKDAYQFIEEMPIDPDVVVWGALLGACRIHGEFELGKYVARRILQLDPGHSGSHVFLSSACARIRDWKGLKKITKRMVSSGTKKIPGNSWIEVNNVVHHFFAGDKSHLQSDKIYMKLAELGKLLEIEGYSPNVVSVVCDVEEEDKEQALYVHSEKIAVAFGLISTPEGTDIRIVKNLRVCIDCHSSIKLISKIVRRDIILRDSNRFHHFTGGTCSCRDYW